VKGRLKPGPNGSPETYERKDGTFGAQYEVTAFPNGIRILKGKPFENAQDDTLPY
jgi:hypothetical protein